MQTSEIINLLKLKLKLAEELIEAANECIYQNICILDSELAEESFCEFTKQYDMYKELENV